MAMHRAMPSFIAVCFVIALRCDFTIAGRRGGRGGGLLVSGAFNFGGNRAGNDEVDRLTASLSELRLQRREKSRRWR